MKKGWKILLWILGVILVLFIIGVIWRLPAGFERLKTAETIEFINTQKITMDDVIGSNLPPEPDPNLVDATIEGIDANNNGIRDDVELAIFEKYPTDLEIRAASLQYAMALQMYLKVFNENTWKAVAFEDARGYACLSNIYSRENLEEYFELTENLIFFVETQQFNTENRVESKDQSDLFTTSLSLPEEDFCDVTF